MTILGVLPKHLQDQADALAAEAVHASSVMKNDPKAGLLLALEARQAYDQIYRQAYKDAYIAEIASERWMQDVQRMKRRKAAAFLLLH